MTKSLMTYVIVLFIFLSFFKCCQLISFIFNFSFIPETINLRKHFWKYFQTDFRLSIASSIVILIPGYLCHLVRTSLAAIWRRQLAISSLTGHGTWDMGHRTHMTFDKGSRMQSFKGQAQC